MPKVKDTNKLDRAMANREMARTKPSPTIAPKKKLNNKPYKNKSMLKKLVTEWLRQGGATK